MRNALVIKFDPPLLNDKINTIDYPSNHSLPDSLDILIEKQSKRFYVSKALVCSSVYIYIYRRVLFFTAFQYHALFIRIHFSLISGKGSELEIIVL